MREYVKNYVKDIDLTLDEREKLSDWIDSNYMS